MIDHVWSVLCKRAIIDSLTNNISLIEATEAIRVTVPPEHPDEYDIVTDLYLVSLWTRRDPEIGAKAEIRVAFLDNSGKEVRTRNVAVDVREKARSRHLQGIRSITVKGPGRYLFVVSLKEKGRWREVASVPLDVEVEIDENAKMMEKST